jgi:hypothetical protein
MGSAGCQPSVELGMLTVKVSWGMDNIFVSLDVVVWV